MSMNSSRLYFRVDRHQINFIRFIFEAYEGVAVLTTLDRFQGVVGLAVAPGCDRIAQEIIDELSQTIVIEALESLDREPVTFYV